MSTDPRRIDPAMASLSAPQKRALIVEDNALLLELMGDALSELGFDVVLTADAEGALEAMAEHGAFDLLLADYILPGGINGRDVMAHFRTLFPEARIILTSGNLLSGDPPAGLASFLQKPFTLAALAALVAQPVAS